MDTKRCYQCDRELTVDNFYKDKSRYDRLSYICKECKARYSRAYYQQNKEKFIQHNNQQKRQRKYRLSDDEYDEMLLAQQGVCKICEKQDYRRLSIDHCHASDNVRGLLCMSCNAVLGSMNDDSVFLRRAADYLDGNL